MGVDAWMLTGDEMQAANEVAKAAGIASSNVKASMLPAAKAAQVRELQKKGKVVAMVLRLFVLAVRWHLMSTLPRRLVTA